MVDQQRFEGIHLKSFEAKDIQHSNEGSIAYILIDENTK
jgi:hypothetical protein